MSEGDRTLDHWNHNPVLYQLSYTHLTVYITAYITEYIIPQSTLELARLKGFEPLTYGLEVRCSIQLSYRRTLLATGPRQPVSSPPLRKAR